MIRHKLVYELQKLKASSQSSVAQGNENLSEFSEYMHVEREVEVELKEKIEQCALDNNPKLLLVCGNVGDGKSHVLSRLNDVIGDNYKIHNDATESHNPNETSNDTLYKLLDGFKDENIDSTSDKIILAINLGTLNKFLEEYGHEFRKLANYVEEEKVLDTKVNEKGGFNKQDVFQHVNFTDYHMYSLTADGPKSKIISQLLDKIVKEDECNPIYQAYISFKEDCKKSDKCPVLFNYEFLKNPENRKAIEYLIIQAIVKSKEIVSVRSLLNFIHDILVPIDISTSNFEEYKALLEKLNNIDFARNILPNYIFEHRELSGLFEKIYLLDPCIERNAEVDEELIKLRNSENPEPIIAEKIGKENTEKIGAFIKFTELNKKNVELSKLYIRLDYMLNHTNKKYTIDSYFDEYMEWLFHFNNNNNEYLELIYDLVKEAGRKWNGNPGSKDMSIINIGRRQYKYRILKEFNPEPEIEAKNKKDIDILTKLSQEFYVSYRGEETRDVYFVHIDYGLFKMLKMVELGYRPNKKDNSNYLSFVEFINKLNAQGSNDPLFIDEVNIGKAIDYKLEKGKFGYKFQKQ